MREIKFRAWLSAQSKDPTEGIMFLPEEVYYVSQDSANCDGDIMSFEDGLILEQFTGLHDKNGKEIFEGDIVKNKFIFGYVFYDEKRAQFMINDERCGEQDYAEGFCGVDVIGNIHENPELLN